MRPVALIRVVAALCFSVGEGLRLLPLPYATIFEDFATR